MYHNENNLKLSFQKVKQRSEKDYQFFDPEDDSALGSKTTHEGGGKNNSKVQMSQVVPCFAMLQKHFVL